MKVIHQPWAPETFGFDLDDDPEFEKHFTVRVRVIKGIEKQENSSLQSSPGVKAEVSSAASGAAIIGSGSILGNLLKYTNNLLIQRMMQWFAMFLSIEVGIKGVYCAD